MFTLAEEDFDRTSGRERIVMFLHGLDIKIRELEQKIHHLEHEQAQFEKDVSDMLKTELPV